MAIKGPHNCQRCSLLGIPVDVCKDVLGESILLHHSGGGQIVTINAEMIMAAKNDVEFLEAINSADLIIPDGAGVAWALRRQGMQVHRTTGIELAKSLLNYAEQNKWKVALVGSAPEVMIQLQENLLGEMPNLQIVLALHGYQTSQSWLEAEKGLQESSPDLVLVALGTPTQEVWSKRVRQGLPGLWIGVGGSFDVWAGTKKRAPKWMVQNQSEWFYRLIKEPKRWRRMLSLPAFLLKVLSQSQYKKY